MPKSGFSKLKTSDTPLYGPRGVLLCGFSAQAQSKFSSLLDMLGLSTLPLIWASKDAAQETVGELMKREHGHGAGVSSDLPRAIIVSGIKEKELHQLMSGCRKAGMKQALWATLTPTSEKWHLARLLDELVAERESLSNNRR